MRVRLPWAGMATFLFACALVAGCGGAASKEPAGRTAPTYEERVRQVLDRYAREATPFRNGPDFMAQVGRRLDALKRGSDGLAEITPPQRQRDVHTAALHAFLRERDILSRFLYDLQRQHLSWKRATDGLMRRLGRPAQDRKRAYQALADATAG